MRPRSVVSIRATRAGRDVRLSGVGTPAKEFLSARPVRAATGEPTSLPALSRVSIRATRAGRDTGSRHGMGTDKAFLSARPVRAATKG